MTAAELKRERTSLGMNMQLGDRTRCNHQNLNSLVRMNLNNGSDTHHSILYKRSERVLRPRDNDCKESKLKESGVPE